MIKYNLNIEDHKEVVDALKQVPDKSEKSINEALETKGTKEMMQSIIEFMPVSKRNKKHAKTSKSLNDETFNLGFRVFAKGGAANKNNSFGYLVFPNEGRGTSNPVAQRFFEKGSEKSDNKIMQYILESLNKAMEL